MRKVGNLNEKTIVFPLLSAGPLSDFTARRATTPATDTAPLLAAAKPTEARARN
jgi:hypothetical protein